MIAALIALAVALVRSGRRRRWSAVAASIGAEASALATVVDQAIPAIRSPAAAGAAWADLDRRMAGLRTSLGRAAPLPPDAAAQSALGATGQALDGLQAAIDSDRALRLGPPPPTYEQVGYSEAVIRQRAAGLAQAARGLQPAPH